MFLDPRRPNQDQVDEFNQQVLRGYASLSIEGDKALLALRERAGQGDDFFSRQLRERIARAEGRL